MEYITIVIVGVLFMLLLIGSLNANVFSTGPSVAPRPNDSSSQQGAAQTVDPNLAIPNGTYTLRFVNAQNQISNNGTSWTVTMLNGNGTTTDGLMTVRVQYGSTTGYLRASREISGAISDLGLGVRRMEGQNGGGILFTPLL